MKLIPVAVVLIFMTKIIIIKCDGDDSSETHDLKNGEVNTNTSLRSHHGMVPGKAKKFIVSLEKPAKTSFNLPPRGQRKNRVSKFQIQHNVPRGNTSPEHSSTRRPKLMEARKFTSQPHAVDHAEELLQRSNFIKRRSQSKFNQFGNEDKHRITEKKYQKNKNSQYLQNRFQNFTDINISSENDSDESKVTEKHMRRKFMKTAASDKVKAIASAPLKNFNTQRNYKIRDLLKNQKYNPRVERKMVPVLVLQKDKGITTGSHNVTTVSQNKEESTTKKNDLFTVENADQNEFIFVKEDKLKISTTASPEDDEIVTSDPEIV